MRRKPIEDGDTGAEYNDEGSVEGTKTPRMNQWEEEGEKRTSRSFFSISLTSLGNEFKSHSLSLALHSR